MIERFAEGTTILHRMDARPKIISAMILTFPAATTNSFTVATGFLALSLLLATISRLPFSSIVKRLAIVNTFTIFLLITLPLTYGGEQLLLLGSFEISREGTRAALPHHFENKCYFDCDDGFAEHFNNSSFRTWS